jgi:glycosyltransferase involved in cell wall biosynthesis
MAQQEFMPLLSRARMFVAPYVEVASGDKDGIPTALLEAMSTGLPSVVTDAGSILEAVTGGVEAIIVPQRDPARLADAIEQLLKDPAAYSRMVEAARHRARSEFDAHVTERALHERIRALLANGKPAS